ncbi:AAA family ATPase [Nonomuraea sp. NPDC049400]|uniref:AAA family ATPase n=1 Tax=Nonomuraea sp. NPDC049400 TaxID=3364352 RepID=UPI00378F84C0
MRAVMLGGAPGVGKTTVARRLLDLVQAGQQLVLWLDVDSLWQHQPWRVDERMTTMVRANLRAVAEHAATAEVDILVITWVFQSAEMHRLVAGLLPSGTPAISVQLHASRETWHQRFESDPERPGLTDFYRSRYTQAQTTVVDHVVDTDGLTPFEVARRVAEVTGVLQPGPS